LRGIESGALEGQDGGAAEFPAVGSDGAAVDGTPEAFIVIEGLAERDASIGADESEYVAAGEADIHRGKPQSGDIFY
jgi:hypothetical protein